MGHINENSGEILMHIPDGYLSPQTYVPLYGVSFIFLSVALKKLKKELATKHVPYLAMAAAFSFLIMMFNIPIPGGTTGHAVGAGIISLLLGPWTAVYRCVRCPDHPGSRVSGTAELPLLEQTASIWRW